MKKIFLITICASIFSCNSYKRQKFEYRNNDPNVWINTYKTEVYFSCIKESFKSDSLIQLMDKKDLFNLYDGFDILAIDNARHNGREVVKNMPLANIKIDADEFYLKSKNYYSYNCLNYYASKELDSIAHLQYNKYFNK